MATRLEEISGERLSIGRTVALLQDNFPDLTISKVRFLEDEGLLKPTRTRGGYRLFAREDIGRLAEILRLQKEHFLPLSIIKDRMAGWRFEEGAGAEDDTVDEVDGGEEDGTLSLHGVMQQTGMPIDVVKSMQSFGLVGVVEREGEPCLEPADVQIMTIFAELVKYGIEPRHIRMYENQAQREALLFQQILTPTLLHKSQKLRDKSQDELKELIRLTNKIKQLILNKALKKVNLLG